MPSTSGRVLRPIYDMELHGVQFWFLCPRRRAGYCDGCLIAASLTCGFGVRCAILPDDWPPWQPFRVPETAAGPLTCGFPGALTEIIWPLQAGGCTGSTDYPEVLPLLQHPRPENNPVTSGDLIQRIDPDLVFHRIDELAQLAPKPRRIPGIRQLALEHAELNARTVPGQQGGDILAPLIISDVISDEIQHDCAPYFHRTGR
jgi:hypothetical protein